ncbi:MAG: hypothetical protein AB1344_02545 [Pseudomonadota bacterium]
MHTILLTAVLACTPLAMAQSPDDPGYERIVKQPPTQQEIDSVVLIPSTQNGISFIGGGVGMAERAALEQWAKDYSLRIEMARKSGEYIGDMRVRVYGGQGETLVDAPSDGPLMYVQLPAGRYAVEVSGLKPSSAMPSMEPRIREVTVVQGRQARLFFVWP